MAKLIKEKEHNPHKVSTATRPTLKGAIAGIAYGTKAGRALQKKIKKYSETTGAKIGASRADFGFIDSRATREPKLQPIPKNSKPKSKKG